MAEAAEAKRRPGRPAQLSREQIVGAVSAVENVDTVTMRELAGRLGVTHGALYRWVRNREELFDLVSEVLTDRIMERVGTSATAPHERLSRLAWAMHDEFLALPGYASHHARPHRHNAHSLQRLRAVVVGALGDAGTGPDMAEQHWYVFVTCTVSWLAASENPLHVTEATPRFEVFVDTVLRGLLPDHPRAGGPGEGAPG